VILWTTVTVKLGTIALGARQPSSPVSTKKDLAKQASTNPPVWCVPHAQPEASVEQEPAAVLPVQQELSQGQEPPAAHRVPLTTSVLSNVSNSIDKHSQSTH
jgi:hypothetical protein